MVFKPLQLNPAGKESTTGNNNLLLLFYMNKKILAQLEKKNPYVVSVITVWVNTYLTFKKLHIKFVLKCRKHNKFWGFLFLLYPKEKLLFLIFHRLEQTKLSP